MRDAFSMEGKVALITGGAGGVGGATGRQLSDAGAAVMMTDIRGEECQAKANSLAVNGARVASMQHDVANESDWKKVVAATIETFGGLDVLVNNAATHIVGDMVTYSLDDVLRLDAINVGSVFLGMKHAALAMQPGGEAGNGGSIINIGSTAAIKGTTGQSAYGATKGAVLAYTKHAAVEFAQLGYGIRVNIVHPGLIETEMGLSLWQDLVDLGLAADIERAKEFYFQNVPMRKAASPEDVARMIHFLASDASSLSTGGEFLVDAGRLAN